MTRIYALSAVALIVALLAGIGVAIFLGEAGNEIAGDPYQSCRTTQIQGGVDQIGGPFELVNTSGETVTDADVITEPTMLYFGYTFCPDVCPLDAVRNVEAAAILAERGRQMQTAFITVDPARDTPERLDVFTGNIDPEMIGLTGSEEQIAAASDAYRTFFNRHDETGDEYYLVDHSTLSYLVMPDAGFVEFFRRDLGPVEMADRVQCFLDAAPSDPTAQLVD